MPGMMDTILNLGLNDEVVEGMIAEKSGSIRRFAYDCYRRFIQMFSDVVMEIAEEIPSRSAHRRGEGEEGRQARTSTWTRTI